MPSGRRSSVAVSVSASQLIKLMKSVTSLVLKKEKKEKSLLQSAFLRKAPTKNLYWPLFLPLNDVEALVERHSNMLFFFTSS